MHEALIPMWFVIAALFVPRVTLLLAFLVHQIPRNDVPMWGNVVLAVLLPRLLIAIYLFEHRMYMWCGIHVIVMLLVWGGGSSSVRKQRSGF